VVGPFAFDAHGNLLSKDFQLYRVVGGVPEYYKPITPPYSL
jgi:hypothetical protein